MISAPILFVLVGSTEFDESFDVGIDPAAADLVTARLGEEGLAEAGEHRTRKHNRAPELSAPSDEFSAAHIFAVDVVGLEAVLAFFVAGHLDPHFFKKTDQILDIQDLGDIGHPHRLIGKQDGAYDLQGLVLCPLRRDTAGKAVAAFNGK